MWASRVMAASLCALAGCGQVVVEPEFADVSISPSAPKTADTLVATSDVADVTLQWTKNGTAVDGVTGSQLDHSLTAKGETWGVDAVSADGDVIGHAEVVIGNTAPSMLDVEVQLTGAATTDVPCAIVTMASDADGDTMTYSATWLRNGVPYGSATMTMFAGDTVPGADHAAGDQFDCTVSGTDGTDIVTASAGARVLVPNGVPPNGTIQMFTTPAVPAIRIEAGGARGAEQGTSASGTHGAIMIGTFTPSPGSMLTVAVGQSPINGNLAGGGGTFVMAAGNVPMVIAGGGGSMFGGTIPVAESVGRIETSGGTAGAAPRATNGQGGFVLTGGNSGAGGGLMSNGGGATGGLSFVGGGTGGGNTTEMAWGGYGGGGARAGLYGQGAGGGYSGGSCGETPNTWSGCGGGGSINMGADQNNTAGANAGTGYVKITW